VRILATSNRDLLHFVETGEFRQDLYYRLNVFPVHVAPLRERAEDIIELAEHFLRSFSRKHGIQHAGLPTRPGGDAGLFLAGNVRELQKHDRARRHPHRENLTISCARWGCRCSVSRPRMRSLSHRRTICPRACRRPGRLQIWLFRPPLKGNEEAPPDDSTRQFQPRLFPR